MRSDELLDALRTQYPSAHGWMLLPQVRDSTGAGSGRTADALAMNAWPSRGLEVHGFELKTSRGDWQRELKKPAKAESIFQYCDRWWVVVPGLLKEKSQIVRPGELPSSWGLYVVEERGCAIAVQAPKLKPKPLDRAFLAAVLRRVAAAETPAAKLAEAFEKGRTQGHEEGRKYEALRLERRGARQELRYQRDSLQHLEAGAERILKGIRRELAELKLPPEIETEDDAPLWEKAIAFFENQFGYNVDPGARNPELPLVARDFLRWALECRQEQRNSGAAS